MTITADKRRITGRHITGQREEAAERRLRDVALQLRELQLSSAKDLERIESSNHFALVGCGSLMDFGVRMGFGAYETRQYANLGKSLAAEPELEALVRSGEVPLAAAAVIGRVLGSPDLLRPDDAWVQYARTEPIKALRKRVRQRVEEHAQGLLTQTGHSEDEDPGGRPRAVEVSVFVKEDVRDDFERARLIASRKARRPLTDGQTLAALVDCYLNAYDPGRQQTGSRRLGPTGEIPDSRYIPLSVRREVFKRAGGCCEAPGCTNQMFLEFAHRVPHRSGSGREAKDLLLLCWRHHTLFDADQLDLSRGFQGVDLKKDGDLEQGRDLKEGGRVASAAAAPPKAGPSKAGPPDRVREVGPSCRASRSDRPPVHPLPKYPRRKQAGPARQPRRVNAFPMPSRHAFTLASPHEKRRHQRGLPSRDRPTASVLRGLVPRRPPAV